jgi:hypothetical protein
MPTNQVGQSMQRYSYFPIILSLLCQLLHLNNTIITLSYPSSIRAMKRQNRDQNSPSKTRPSYSLICSKIKCVYYFIETTIYMLFHSRRDP